MHFKGSYIRSVALRGFDRFVTDLGGDPIKMLIDCRINPEMLNRDHALFSYQSHSDLFELAAERLGEPNFGLKYACYMTPKFANLGPVMIMAKFEKTVGDWLKSTIRHMAFHCNAAEMRIIESAQQETFTLSSSLDPCLKTGRQIDECNVALGNFMVHEATAPFHIGPERFRFRHRAPKDLSFHRELFGCDLEFDCEFLEAVYPISVLSHPIDSKLQYLKPVLDLLSRPLIARHHAREDIVIRARALTPMFFGTGRCNLDCLAEAMDIHPKMLQRGLADQGETFSSVLDTVREHTARRMLSDTDASIAHIAGLLDYSGPTPFILAFKRWTDTTPARYRKMTRKDLIA